MFNGTVAALFVGCALFSVASRAVADDAAETLIHATCKLVGDNSVAAGLVVARDRENGSAQRYIVTAHHVLARMNGDACVLVSRKRQGDGAYERLEIRIPIHKSGAALWKKHASRDIAVLPLPPDVQVDAVPFESLASEDALADVRVGDAVRLAVFPERVEASAVGFPIVRGGVIASYPLLPATKFPVFLVDATAWTGDSGGPVMHDRLRTGENGPLVIGIVRGMRTLFDTVKESRFVERRTLYPLGLAEIMHASFAREVIVEMNRESPP